MKFCFGDIVVVDGIQIGVVVKCWSGNTTENSYDIYVRSYNGIKNYKEDEIERYMVRHKELNEEELVFRDDDVLFGVHPPSSIAAIAINIKDISSFCDITCLLVSLYAKPKTLNACFAMFSFSANIFFLASGTATSWTDTVIAPFVEYLNPNALI